MLNIVAFGREQNIQGQALSDPGPIFCAAL